MDRTLKIPAYSDAARTDVSHTGPVEATGAAAELEKKTAQLEDEKSKTLELLKTIVQLRESLKQEQDRNAELARRAADLEAKANELALLDANQLARKNAQLEEEKKRTLELMNMVEQLRENIRQDHAKMADTLNISARLEAKTREAALLETRVRDLSAMLTKIASIASMGKADSGS